MSAIRWSRAAPIAAMARLFGAAMPSRRTRRCWPCCRAAGAARSAPCCRSLPRSRGVSSKRIPVCASSCRRPQTSPTPSRRRSHPGRKSIVFFGDAPEREKYDAFAASNAALAASGTVALELAMAKLPHVVAYRLNPLTHAVVRRMVKIDYIHLLNLILGREAVPELIQDECTPDRLATAVAHLLDDAKARE